ncbi:unnamed protein product [marine sediment metagenome]|uniref:Uncharacterized protein n=1 Tax=marine sediment metagenome TaxID=412755 RepID=X1FCH0_9ZZZZ
MTNKVKLAIFDKDQKARTVKHYPVSDNGDQIKVKSGGEGHFMPHFGNESFIEFPYRALSSPWKISWDRIYFVKKGGKKCVDFKSGIVYGPNPEDMKKAVSASLLDKLGKDEPPFPAWIIYLILLAVIGIAAKVFGVIA